METRRTKRVSAIASATSTLNTLPPELIYYIVGFLDNKSWLQLAIAWRPFLHAYAKTLDPWNVARKRMVDAVAQAGFRRIQRVQFAESEVHAAKLYKFILPTPTARSVVTLIEYLMLDRYRERDGNLQPFKLWIDHPDLIDAWLCAFCSDEVSSTISALYCAPFGVHIRFYSCYDLSALNSLEQALLNSAFPLIALDVGFELVGNIAWRIKIFLNGLRSNQTLQSLRCIFVSPNDLVNENIIDAVAGHVRLRELETQLMGPLSVGALVRLLRFGTVKLHSLVLACDYQTLSQDQMSTLGAALAANATIKTLEMAAFDTIRFRAGPHTLAAFLNGYLNADRSRSVLESICLWKGDACWLEQSVKLFKTRTNGRVAVSFY